MKSFLFSLVSISLCYHVAFVCVANATNKAQLIEIEAQILRDQVADYHQQISQLSAQRTYEEGLKDGFANANSVEYTKGYHAATEQLATQAENNLLTTK